MYNTNGDSKYVHDISKKVNSLDKPLAKLAKGGVFPMKIIHDFVHI